ncbi:hypothetical protein JXA48_04360 [Candidatus Woesearchaeota archaeon]|nr:hypothetical protein [Candidatus Woesearchaeota archaeon]
MNKLARLIEGLDINDLELIKKDIDSGNVDKLVRREIKLKKANKITTCPVCSSEVKEGEGLHLQFGPLTFRKKATFDGVDCLCYFLENNLKKK